ncbi:MAG: glycosyltransferase family 2 protein [Gammaproteobacteria bacterium]
MKLRTQSTENSAQVCAIVVAYFPDTSMLRAALHAIYAQVQAVLIVDNTPGRHDLCEAIVGLTVTVLALGHNRGVAGGQNVGATWAQARGFTHVLLMDQDSVVAPDLVVRLLAAEISLKAEGKSVAAVAPRFLHVRRKQAALSAVAQGWSAGEVVETRAGGKCQQLDYVISSGSLIELEKLEIVGEMEEALFIDYVDIEWGLRARSKGYHCYGVYEAHIEHCLGDTDVALPWMKKRRVVVHGPLRHYYFFRNAIHLYKRPYASWAWVLNDARRLVLKYVFYSTITAPRRQHLRMMTVGIWHGVRGRRGPFPEQ